MSDFRRNILVPATIVLPLLAGFSGKNVAQNSIEIKSTSRLKSENIIEAAPADAPAESSEADIPSANENSAVPGEQSTHIGAEFQAQGFKDPRDELTNEKHAFDTPFGQISWRDIANKLVNKDGRIWVSYKGFNLRLTLNANLQSYILKTLQNQRYVAGAIVILESKSGKILAMAERRGEGSNPLITDESVLVAARAPAASLMKIVTATAAIEKTAINPEDEIKFRGGCSHLRNQNWLRDSVTDRQHLTLAKAFGASCNTVFARIALYNSGLATLRQFGEKYMFNKPITSDLRLETSAALMPQLETATALEVGEAGAGFVSTKLSPIHAALLSSAAGNNGVMMAPYIVDAAFDNNGKQVYTAQPREVSRIYSKATNEKMIKLMQETILSGTSRKFFRRSGTSRDRFDIGGKTGTLSDAEARGTLYTWFSGLAPLDSPNNVAIGTLVSSPKTWVVRASSLAQLSLAQYLRLEKLDKSVASQESP